MLSDHRRPILLANVLLIDPPRDFDGVGDVLIADGMIRDSKRRLGAVGMPEGTDIVNCAGKIVASGLIDMRAFVGKPGASHRETFACASQAAATGTQRSGGPTLLPTALSLPKSREIVRETTVSSHDNVTSSR